MLRTGNHKFKIAFLTLFCSTIIYLSQPLHGQVVSGTVLDKSTGWPLIGASVVVKGTTKGETTDFDGKFSFDAQTEPPFTLVISYLGYDKVELNITSEMLEKPLTVKLNPTAVALEGVEVTDTRITEKLQQSPLTVESMSLDAIKETPAASFYNGLANLKGVDMTTASLGFVIINTRGFNSTRPVRSLQLVDGADNQAPGLNFSIGNFAGVSELDIQKVELIVGASSALYGPNAFNGVINMITKNPFYHPGLSVMVKGGERQLFESAIRWAQVIENRAGQDKFAYKLNFYFMRANDWEADNYDPTEQSVAGRDNPGGYDAVNIYGDENLTEQTNNFMDNYGIRNFPGLGIFYRTGYKEVDLVDYDTRNIKINSALHYRLTPDVEMSLTYNFGTGTTVYQGENRYSLRGIAFHQTKFEIAQRDKFFIRAYATMENAGDSYDAVFTAIKLQELVKDDNDWSNDYSTYWIRHYRNRVKNLPGYPPDGPWWFDERSDSIINQALMVMELYHDSLVKWHADTRAYADGVGNPNFGNKPRFEPGTARFDSIFHKITHSTVFAEGGTKFYDKSKLYHIQGEYKFTQLKWLDITVGGNIRFYRPLSRGTIFSDTITRITLDTIGHENGTPIVKGDTAYKRITNWEYGISLQLQKKVLQDRLIFTAAGRLDKNENFDYLFSPALSIVYSQAGHTVRTTFTSAIRNPTLQDQYLYYNVGRAILVGNIDGVDSLVTLKSLQRYIGTLNYDHLVFFDVPPVRPEKVKTIEFGYRGTLFQKVYVDASAYYSWYKDFLGYKLGSTPPPRNPFKPAKLQVFRVSANSPDQVVTYGISAGVNYYFYKNYMLTGNYSWNVLDRKGSKDPIIPAFNTPEHKFNVSISGSEIAIRNVKYFGFNINYKWVQGFLFEGSPQFTGHIPTYDLLDAQVNYRYEKWHTTFKIGASNVLNKKQYQTYGGPRIGRLAYISILYENKELGKKKVRKNAQ